MKQIEIRIGTNGTMRAETLGIKGKDCLKYLERIEKMADAVTTDSEFTDEYYERNNLTEELENEVSDNE